MFQISKKGKFRKKERLAKANIKLETIEERREFQIFLLSFLNQHLRKHLIVSIKAECGKLMEMGIPKHLLLQYYLLRVSMNQTCLVRIDKMLSSLFRERRVVRQGCKLFLDLFNLYNECIMREALDSQEGRICISGAKMSNLRFADIILIVANENEIIGLIQRVENRIEDKQR